MHRRTVVPTRAAENWLAAGPGIGTAFALSAILLLAGAPLYPVAGRELAARNGDVTAEP